MPIFPYNSIALNVVKDNLKEGVLDKLSNIESGVNMVKQAISIHSNTSEKEKTKMIITNRFNEEQSNIFKDIKNDPVLKSDIQHATNADFASFALGGEGTLHRFAAVKNISKVEHINYFHNSYNKDIISPINNYALGTRSLANWDPSYSLKTEKDLFRQDVLNKIAFFSKNNNWGLRNAAMGEKSSIEVISRFNQLKLLGEGISCLYEEIKEGSAKDFSTNKQKEVISESFTKALTRLKEMGVEIPQKDFKMCLDQLLKEDLL